MHQEHTSNLEALHTAQNPQNVWAAFWSWFTGRKPPAPSALTLAHVDLDNCRANALQHARDAEYHTAMSRMLKDREKRLVAEIERMAIDWPKEDTVAPGNVRNFKPAEHYRLS